MDDHEPVCCACSGDVDSLLGCVVCEDPLCVKCVVYNDDGKPFCPGCFEDESEPPLGPWW